MWRQKRAAREWGDLDGEEAVVNSCAAGSDRLMGWERWGEAMVGEASTGAVDAESVG